MSAFETVTETPVSVCRECGNKNDHASGSNGKRPSPGDVSLCIRCATISVYTEGLMIREPTPDEMVDIAGDPDIARTRLAILMANKQLATAQSRARH